MTEPVAVVIAQAEVRNDVRIKTTDTDNLRVQAGRPFSIRFAYRIYESSTKEDQWTFRLSGRLGEGIEAVNETRHKDRLLMRDDVWAHLSQDHLCPEPGEYELSFEAGASLQRRDWGDASPHEDVAEQTVDGVLRIRAV